MSSVKSQNSDIRSMQRNINLETKLTTQFRANIKHKILMLALHLMYLLIRTLSKCMSGSYIDLTKPIKLSTTATNATRPDLSSAVPFFQREFCSAQHVYTG